MASKHWLGTAGRRSYWTATTFRSPSPLKLAGALQETVASLAGSERTAPRILLFTISKRIPSALLAGLVESIQRLPPAVQPIGCLTQDPSPSLYSASVAQWAGEPARIVPFTSTISSRPSVAVGREIIPNGSIEKTDSAAKYLGLAHHLSAESTDSDQLPEELRRISPSSIDSLIFFSAPAPQPFLNTLQRHLPAAKLMGLVGSSTAFETGRPSTLFRSHSILGHHGAVGIALLKTPYTSANSPLVSYSNLKTLGAPMRITEAQGNIILSLDSKRATRHLLDVINKSDGINESAKSTELIMSKEKEFYLGFLDDKNLVVEVCRIIGGSTSRGTMALDREKEIQGGQLVQFIHSSEPGGNAIQTGEQRPDPSHTGLSQASRTAMVEFSCSDLDHLSHAQPHESEEDQDTSEVERMEGLFYGSSEAGFVPRHQTIVNLGGSSAQYML
ncbi:hypothetical protein PCANC_27914 [Puccinia coronata f. sp. avenae]|uniref:FIST domain-containing protein n=1 Tax=Puccinia coronata f. sp. avenae TaxID=200324 RepID=A0A2N5UB78_9BASI|nr:hypothetical protein PCANC_27914 [Puccinia coronata f. sp. avenae]PLW07638.1 hypothetical protein PCASD_25953 [Puccinia coronata f. sp. avenae]PLW34952.1 hypothetical protein PCASD_14255 [Puccinia coronata f. sp. avenae]